MKFFPIPLALILIIASISGTAATAQSQTPTETVESFLQWYLPVAFAMGSHVVLDKRMDAYVENATLAKWRKMEKSDAGIGAVPFVGQDYVESWAKHFQVDKASEMADRATVQLTYPSPEWTQKLEIELVKTAQGWRIKDYRLLEPSGHGS